MREFATGKLTAEDVRDFLNCNSVFDDTIWTHGEQELVFLEENLQTMADELNATLGRGTCRNEWAEFGKFRCSECWMQIDSISTNTVAPRPIKFCPNCGCEVVLYD